ncbi:MAG: DUF86 domain-containing protein [Candidatus Firestonebacteria bacterium]
MKNDKVFINHIRDEVDYIIRETKQIDYNDLMCNETLKKALIRSLEIIGEATKNLSEDFRDKYAEVKWKELAGLRDKLIHFYFGVDWDTVGDVIKNKIPQLEKNIQNILKDIEKNEI